METKTLTTKEIFAKIEVRKKFEDMLGKRASQFITSVLQIAASNDLLSKSDPISVYNSAAVAATLDLPLNNNLGYAYLVPYNVKQKDGSMKTVAQFQIGWKGLVQLAHRTNQYKRIASTPIYDGQLIEENPLTGFVFDFTKKKSDTVIGYASYFELTNGFSNTFYMTKAQVTAHARRFSKTFQKNYGNWVDDFESMALKTTLKLNLGKWGPLSVEMQTAIKADQAVLHDDKADNVEYVDHEEVTVDKERERVRLMLSDCQTMDDLAKLEPHIPKEMDDLYLEARDRITEPQLKLETETTKGGRK